MIMYAGEERGGKRRIISLMRAWILRPSHALLFSGLDPRSPALTPLAYLLFQQVHVELRTTNARISLLALKFLTSRHGCRSNNKYEEDLMRERLC